MRARTLCCRWASHWAKPPRATTSCQLARRSPGSPSNGLHTDLIIHSVRRSSITQLSFSNSSNGEKGDTLNARHADSRSIYYGNQTTPASPNWPFKTIETRLTFSKRLSWLDLTYRQSALFSQPRSWSTLLRSFFFPPQLVLLSRCRTSSEWHMYY